MNVLADRLREAREARDVSIDEAVEATRIPRTYVEALEAGDWSAFTSDVHLRGFLRNYSLFLGVAPEETASLYDQLTGKRRSNPLQQALSVRGRGVASTLFVDMLLALVLLAVLALGGFVAYRQYLEWSVTPEPAAVATAAPTREPPPVTARYEMGVDLDYQARQLRVQEEIGYTNVTSTTLTDLVLNVPANHAQNVFDLNEMELAVAGVWQDVRPKYSLLDTTLRVELPRGLEPGEDVTLRLDFELRLPRIKPDEEFTGASLGYSTRALSLGNWHPVLAVYRKEKGWYSLPYYMVGDPYVTEIADYEVTITATQGITLAGAGLARQGDGQWHATLPKARSFAFVASDRHQRLTGNAAGIEVQAYYFPGHEEAAGAVLEAAVQSLELFQEIYGPYPYATFSVLETEFAGGLEFSSLCFLGSTFYEEYDGTTRNTLIPLTAHEVAHQWWYGVVGNDQVGEPWLDEALAVYSGLLYYERYYPADTQWWWDTVVEFWAPTGNIDSGIYAFRGNREYEDAVYRRGSQFMADLRQAMGDDAFFAFLQEYYRQQAYRLSTSEAFFELVPRFSTVSLMPLQEEYFRGRIVP